MVVNGGGEQSNDKRILRRCKFQLWPWVPWIRLKREKRWISNRFLRPNPRPIYLEPSLFELLLFVAITQWSNWPLVLGRCCLGRCCLAIGVWSLLLFEPSLFEPLLATRCCHHTVHKTKQGLNGLRDLVGCHGFGLTFSAAPTTCLKSEECSYLFFYFGLGIKVFGGKKKEIQNLFHNREKNLVIFFCFQLVQC